MADLSSLYPKPAKGPLEGASFGDLLNLARGMQEMQGQQALGRIMQENIDPATGRVNQEGMMRAMSRPGPQSYIAPKAIEAITARAAEQQALAQATNTIVAREAGPLATSNKITDFDIDHAVARIASATGRPASEVRAKLFAGMPDDQAGRKAYFTNLLKMGLGPEGVATPTAAPPGPGGETRQQSLGTSLTAQHGGAAAPPAGGAPAGGPQVTGNPMGSERSAEAYQAALQRASNYGQDIYPWQEAARILEQSPKGFTGPGSKGRQQLEEFVYALSPTVARWSGIPEDKIKNYAELEKYLTQATQSRATGFGAHTDMQLATAISGNPNVHINDLANKDVVKAAIALRRMEHAQALAASKAGPVRYSEAAARWGATMDPRAFAIDMMPAKEVERLKKELKGKERARFNQSLQAAIDAGVVTMPGQ